MNFLVNPNLFINRYLKGTKVTETFNQYRLGNKGSKCILKDGSGYFDHELGNHTSLFNEVMNREGLSTSQTIQFCKDNHMLLNQNEMVEVSNTQSKYKIDRLKSLEDNLIPFGFTKAHEYLLKRGILETAIPENVIFFESIKNLLCHKITNINDEVIGYQTFKIDSNINKVKPPKIYDYISLSNKISFLLCLILFQRRIAIDTNDKGITIFNTSVNKLKVSSFRNDIMPIVITVIPLTK
jgi:hypothetical protein